MAANIVSLQIYASRLAGPDKLNDMGAALISTCNYSANRALLLVCIAVGMLLTGCGQDDEPQQSTKVTPEAVTVEHANTTATADEPDNAAPSNNTYEQDSAPSEEVPERPSTPSNGETAAPAFSPGTRTTHQYLAKVGRSPLQQPGETMVTPIAAVRLVPEDVKPPAPIPDGVIAWHDADKHMNEIVRVQGKVVVTRKTNSVCFLNFHKDWRGKFYVIIFKDALDDFPESPEKYFLNQTIQVTGQVEKHRGSPQIQVNDANQIQIVKK